LNSALVIINLIIAYATIDWPRRKNKYMSQTQYLKMLQKEIQKINKAIDLKIMKGEDYRKEARDHRLMLRRLRYLSHKTLTQKIIHLFFQKNIYA
jgi:hypothetical protein